MANRTVKDAHSIKGTNPQYLVEKIIRTRIYECRYWKEECFALTAALIVDKAMELKYVGGVYGGNIKPVPFICLLLKMLQIQPEKDIIVEFIKNEDFKYVRALGAIYMRLTGTSVDCYKYLEPLYYDYRKLKRIDRNGAFHIIHMDELIDELVREERVCDIILPRIQKRIVLEESNVLETRVSAIEENIEDVESEEEDDFVKELKKVASPPERKPKRSPPPHTRRPSSPHRKDSHRHKSPSKRTRERGDKRHRSPEHKHRVEDRHKRSSKKSRHERDDERHRSSRHGVKERHHREKDRDQKSRRGGGREERGGKSRSGADHELREANEMRAKLGLAPLRP